MLDFSKEGRVNTVCDGESLVFVFNVDGKTKHVGFNLNSETKKDIATAYEEIEYQMGIDDA